MNIQSIDNIKKQYIEVLAKDSKYNNTLKVLLSRKENEPISHFSFLNPEQLPDKDNEERELQELLLDLTALNSGIKEISARADNIISSIDSTIESLDKAIQYEEDRLQDINMICGQESDYNMVIPVFSSDFTDNKFKEINDKTLAAFSSSETSVDYEIVSISGNGILGNDYVYNEGNFEIDTDDYSDTSLVKDESDITGFEYQRFNVEKRELARDNLFNHDNKEVECVITLNAASPVSMIKIVSEPKNLTIKRLEVSSDGISWQDAINRELIINNKEYVYEDGNYIYGSGIIAFPVSKFVRGTFSSNEFTEDQIAERIIDKEGNEQIVEYCNSVRRKKIRLNSIKLYSANYSETNIESIDLLTAGSVDKISLFASEYIPDHFDSDTEYIEYYLIINGTEHKIVPANLPRDGVKIIKYSEVSDPSKVVTDTEIIKETIKSAKIKLVIHPHSTSETPFVSNLKLCLGKDTGSIYV